MNNYMRKHVLSLLAVFLVLTAIIHVIIHPVMAQEISLGVYPPILQIQTEAPAGIKTPFTIVNSSNDTLAVDIILKPFTASPKQDGTIQLLPDNQPIPGNDPHIFDNMQIYDGSSVITSLTLAPQQQKTLELHIGLPKDEPPSDYYFSILFISHQQTLQGATATGITGGIGINVLLSIGPKGDATGFLQDFSVPWFFSKGPVPFTTRVENTSNFFIVPKGNIVIKNMLGQAVGTVQLLPVNILSKTSRFIPDTKSNSLSYAIWKESVLLGVYTATVTVKLSEQGPLFTKTIYFFAMPYTAIIGIIIVSLLIASVIYHLRRKLKRT